MLTIKNRNKLIGEKVLSITTDGYNIEGVYEYEDYYQIHIRSKNRGIVDESLILQRNKTNKDNGTVYSYYTLYNSNEPQRRKQLNITQIRWKDMFIHNIELILQMHN